MCIVALARAIVYTPPNKPGKLNTKLKMGEEKFLKECETMKIAIKRAFCEYPDYGEVCRQLTIIGDAHEKLDALCHIVVGIPVNPMLANPTKGV